MSKRCLQEQRTRQANGKKPQHDWQGSVFPQCPLFPCPLLLLNLFSDASELGPGQVCLLENTEAGQKDNPWRAAPLGRGSPFYFESPFQGAWIEEPTSLAIATFHDMPGCTETACKVERVVIVRFMGFLSIYLLREGVNLKSNFLKRLYQESR